MSKLVIVESPAKAKTINRYLGKGFQVRASMGHVRDLPKSSLGVDIEHDFEPVYRVLPTRKKVISQLKKLSGKAEMVYLATDLDREGEAIAWHLAQALKLPKKRTRRVIFNEITKKAIQRAFDQPMDLDDNKVNAQQARRILDRIVGYKLSPLLWNTVRRGLSAGRVQSVAVRLIVEREREIEAFKPVEYWEIEADLAPKTHRPKEPKKFRAKLTKVDGKKPTIPDEANATSLVKEIQSSELVVKEVKRTERSLRASPPFITSTLQQQASVQLRFSAKKTMMLAQQLYEGVELGEEGSIGLITYMRTDSFHVANSAIDECRELIEEQFGKKYLTEKPQYFRSGKRAQGAHEAIRPTSAAYTPEKVKPFLGRDQHRLYELIWKRFIATQMAPGRLAVSDVSVEAGRALFTAQGRELVFDGHLKVTGFDKKTEVRLPTLAEGDVLKLLKLDPSQHFTKPPPRYTEATLVKTLEKLGIGRPSTYAPIISTIQARHYVTLEKRQFRATDLGKTVTDQLVEHFADIMEVTFTSGMEERLDKVEDGEAGWLETLRAFYEPFAIDLEKAGKNMKRPEPEQTEHKCKDCGKPMLKRWSRNGPFLGCSGYPECRFTMPLDSEGKPAERPKPEETDEKCEKCGSPMVIRTGRHGRFMACSGYPKCKNTRSLEETPEIPEDLKKCEECGKEMVIRRSRRGLFLGCSGYPKCRNTKPLPKKKKDK